MTARASYSYSRTGNLVLIVDHGVLVREDARAIVDEILHDGHLDLREVRVLVSRNGSEDEAAERAIEAVVRGLP